MEEFTKEQLKEIIRQWRKNADHDWKTAQSLWNSKRYDACLFFCHLVIEKLLKGLVTQKTSKVAPFTHDLVELAEKADIEVNQGQISQLAEFTSFNIRCRYNSDKFAFYKKCTRKFSEPYFKEARRIILWLKKFYQEDK